MLYGMYNGLNLDYGSIIWQQLVQSLLSSSKHSEVSCGRFWSIITKWAMDRNRVPIMVDSLLSSIVTFHTTKIIVTDPTKFSYIGSIPETMLGCISTASNILQQYRKRKVVGSRELTPTMLRSIEEADKPAKRGKKTESHKEGPVTKPSKGQTPKKRKGNKASPSPPQPKKQKKPARKLILQSSSSSDSEYVPPRQKNTPSSDYENESSDEEVSGRDTTSTTTTKPTFTIPNPPLTEPTFTTKPPPTTEPPTTSKPLSPTPSTETTPILGAEDLEFDSTYFSPYRVQSEDDDDEPITKRHLQAVNNKLDQMLSSSSSGAYLDATLKALFSSVVVEHSASLTAAAKAIEASTSQCHQASRAVAAAKNAATVTSSIETLQQTLQSECSKVEAARLALQQANEAFHANFNERLSQLEADLAMENGVMDELARHTNQLKLQTHKLKTAHAEIDDLKSEREVIRSSGADIHSILLHLIEGHDPLVTITTRRHLAEKLRPALDVLSRIEGVPVIGVQPQKGGEKELKQEKQKTNQPPPSTSKLATKPKEDDVYIEIPRKPVPKVDSSEKRTEEISMKEKVELEQKRKEAKLLEKKKAMFPEWTKESLQSCAIDEPTALWLEPIMAFSLDNSRDAQFDMPITRKAFVFHCFNSTAAIPSPDRR
ncbi:uncharacterized protein LOC128133385 [Lactuca sativa]|uniref:uncharacterized protein LOC128133385 n=1 Tax=Lactuca sativa TaxID=4236 RepID=UPI0022AEB8B0|nr:uncharacterized protein LOC128133385 [Lactuca sativa]